MKNPKIRFKGCTEDWEQRKVSDVAEIIAGGTPCTKEKSYWEPKEIPWLSSGEVHKKYITFTDDMISQTGMNNSSAKMVAKDSVLIALAGQGKTRGTVAINRIPLTTNQSIAAMTFNGDFIPEFVFCNLENRYDELRRMSSGDGSRGGLNKQLVGDIEIPYTEKREQKRIGSIFTSLDTLITLHQRKCEETKKLKKYMLQKMFPKDGATVPEIRFSGFTEDWEQRKLGDIIVDYVEKNPEDEELPVLTSSRQGIQRQDEHFGSEQKHDTTDYNVIPKGYCTYRNRSDDKSFTFNVNDCVERGIVSKFYPVFSIENGNAKFITEYLNTNAEMRNKIAILAVGTSQVVLSLTNLKALELFVPSKEEQDKIGKAIVSLDHLITLHQRKCDELQNIKKYMLQNMFV